MYRLAGRFQTICAEVFARAPWFQIGDMAQPIIRMGGRLRGLIHMRFVAIRNSCQNRLLRRVKVNFVGVVQICPFSGSTYGR
jgi:hypothetical protein